MKKVLITGGSGLLGSYLSTLLLEKGFEVAHLSRSSKSNGAVKVYKWNPAKNYIEDGALERVNYIIHLAGEGIAEKRWTDKQKKIIIDSRVDGPVFLKKIIIEKNISLDGFFSASGINYYGSKTSDKINTENDLPSNEFISDVVVQWEKAAFEFSSICRVATFRFGLILDKNKGGLVKMITPVKYYIGSALGSGKQWMPWIHLHDAANCFLHAISEKNVSGVYNAIAQEQVNNSTFIKTLGKAMHRPIFFPRVPAFILKLLFGELSSIILEGSRASNEKLIQSGFKFKYEKLDQALINIVENKSV